MTDILSRRPSEVFAERLPPMDPAERESLLAKAKAEVMRLLLERLAASKEKDRAQRKKMRAQTALARGIANAELRIERRLLGVMEAELKAAHGEKPWRRSQHMRRAALYRRLKAGQGASGVLPRKRPVDEKGRP